MSTNTLALTIFKSHLLMFVPNEPIFKELLQLKMVVTLLTGEDQIDLSLEFLGTQHLLIRFLSSCPTFPMK